jgi:hypothetical protein
MERMRRYRPLAEPRLKTKSSSDSGCLSAERRYSAFIANGGLLPSAMSAMA